MRQLSSRLTRRAARLLRGWLGWVGFAVLGYVFAMYLTTGLIFLLSRLGIFSGLDATSFALTVRVVMYAILAGVLLAVPLWLKRPVTRESAGLRRLMEWPDIGLGVAGVVVYMLLAMGALALLKLVPGVDVSQTQDLGLGYVYGFSRIAIFVVLVVITPFVEELLFRGILYGGLRERRVPAWGAALIVSVLFGLAHGQLNVGIDVFCLSMVASYLREITGSVWAGVVLHMIKNFIAFAVVFMIGQGG